MIRGWGGVTLVYRKRLQDAPAYRLNHEEVAQALQEGISFIENMNPVEAMPDEFGTSRRWRSRARDGSRDRAAGAHGAASPPARCRTSPTRRSIPGSFELDGKQKFFQGFKAVRRRATARARTSTLEPDAERLLHVAQHRRQVRHLLRRQPPALRRQRRQGDGLGEARLPARRRRCSPTRSRRSIRREQPAREARVAAPGRRSSTISCWRASSASCG